MRKGTLLGFGLYEIILGIAIGIVIVLFVIFLYNAAWGTPQPEPIFPT